MASVSLHDDPAVHDRRWFLLGVMCLSLVLVVMSVSAMNVALPTMQRDLGASATALQWIVDSYAIVFAGLLLTAGALGDRFGRKGALLGGLVVFGAGSIVGGLATTSDIVITGRVISGIGAAFIMPATLSLISAIFPPHERRKAIAIWAGFAGAGGAIGPIVSGALLEGFWWGAAFLINLPLIVFTFVAVAIFSPRSRDDTVTPLDPVGAGLSLIGIAALLFGIIEGAERGWTDGLVLAGFAVAIVFLVAFFAWERRVEHPMLPLGLFADRRFSAGSGVITVAFFAMFGLFFMFSQYLQFARGYSPLEAGLATLPLAATLVAISPRSALLAERFGTGRMITIGFLLLAAGFAVMATVGVSTPYLLLVIALVLLGAGMSVTAAPATGSIMSSVPMSKAGVGSAVNDTTRELGGALGIAVLGSIVNSVYRSRIALDGLELPAGAVEAAEESIGAATGVASQLGADGQALTERAAAAFTDAFNVSSAVSVGLALTAAAVVALTFSRSREQAAIAASAVSSGPVAQPVPVTAD